ncbi:MAG: tRNA (adenosine(37)-N6)-threonylcarbamoyltransferase complex transferase subunit TsaD [Kiritimatiellia bacterium]
MIVLGIESSCDETAAAVVKDGAEVLSSVIYSQVPLHQPYGGVVPEIASRSHIEKIRGILEQAMVEAFGSCDWTQIDAIAATYGPGLASSLLVGWTAAKGLAISTGKPLLAMNHMHAHLHSVRLGHCELRDDDLYPQFGLAVSGGHTCFIHSPKPFVYELLGQTIDDAAGEAFDKAAKLLGLGYPGGPVIDRLARTIPEEQKAAIAFPKGRVAADHPLPEGLLPELCVSFSGLKTALLTFVRKHPPENEAQVAQLCASYQEAIVTALSQRVELALKRKHYKSFAVGGGVSLNGRLREALAAVAEKQHVTFLTAAPKFCGDNAAMIAGLASAGGGIREATLSLDIDPSLPV